MVLGPLLTLVGDLVVGVGELVGDIGTGIESVIGNLPGAGLTGGLLPKAGVDIVEGVVSSVANMAERTVRGDAFDEALEDIMDQADTLADNLPIENFTGGLLLGSEADIVGGVLNEGLLNGMVNGVSGILPVEGVAEGLLANPLTEMMTGGVLGEDLLGGGLLGGSLLG